MKMKAQIILLDENRFYDNFYCLCCHPYYIYTEKYLLLFRFDRKYYVASNPLKVLQEIIDCGKFFVEVGDGYIYIIETGRN